MATMANIVVPDAAATPVNHTFVPSGKEGLIAKWTEKLASLPIGWWGLTQSLRQPVNGNKQYRYQMELAIPTLRTYTDAGGNSQTVVDYVNRVQVTAILAAGGTLQSRKDIRKLAVGILNDSQAIDLIENLNAPFGG